MRIGFVPLVDCAVLAIAQELGFFERHQLDVELRKAQTWAQVRDKLLSGELDAAHLLSTMPLQLALDAPADEPPVVYAFTLGHKGNGIILSNALWNEGVRDAASLALWLAQRPQRNLVLGVVFPRGPQEYFTRTWLARGGLELGQRIALSSIPPQEMVGRLRKGGIDGFCVAEPWSRRAAASKLGRLVAQSGKLLPGLGDKVLGVRSGWHRGHSLEHSRVIRALSQASDWLEDPANRAAAVDIIASKRYVNTPKNVVEAALKDFAEQDAPDRGAFGAFSHDGPPDFPSQSHARWYLDQMRRWGHVDATSADLIDLSSVCLEGFHRSVTSGMARPPRTPAGIDLAADR
ncbi:MAG TPA: CmpA/NrtA family ABC transporter substrate-binding protein [Fibrobacteria bacterium]|nr:CmpA/NrtA family ABC transporter substrate-binding protein [Fibrobacteria bacterium]